MTTTLTSRAGIKGVLTAARDGGDDESDLDVGLSFTVSDGTAAGEANAVYSDDFSIAASGALSLDLSGSLVDRFGDALVFTSIKEILVIAAAANVNDVVVGNGSNPFLGPFGAAAHTAAVKPGGRFGVANYSAAGWPVVASTGDILKLANSGSGSAVAGTIVLVGTR